MRSHQFAAALVVLVLIATGQVFAQGVGSSFDVPEADLATGGTHTTLGLGVGVAPDYEGSDNYEAVPLPLLIVAFENNMSIAITGNTGKVNLIPDKHWRGGLAVEYIGERDDVESQRVRALTDIDAALMVGGYFGYDAEYWRANIEALTDVSDNNDGTIARIRAGYKLTTTGDWRTNIDAFTTWADGDYMDTYFGITNAGAAASGLPVFQADEGFKDVGVTLTAEWKASDQWSVFSVVGYKYLIDDAKNSPIVDAEGDANQFFGGVLIAYRF